MDRFDLFIQTSKLIVSIYEILDLDFRLERNPKNGYKLLFDVDTPYIVIGVVTQMTTRSGVNFIKRRIERKELIEKESRKGREQGGFLLI